MLIFNIEIEEESILIRSLSKGVRRNVCKEGSSNKRRLSILTKNYEEMKSEGYSQVVLNNYKLQIEYLLNKVIEEEESNDRISSLISKEIIDNREKVMKLVA